MQQTQERKSGVWQWSWIAGIYLACSSASTGTAIGTSADSATAALHTLSTCAAITSPAVQGLTALQVECPELEAAITELGFAETLQEGWRDSLTGNGLNDLVALTQRYQTSRLSDAPTLTALPGILSELHNQHPVQPKSWWQALKEWLQSFYPEKKAASDSSWLTRWLTKFRPSADVTRTLVYVLLSIVVLAAIAVVINELRAAGLLKRREKRIKPHSAVVTLPAYASLATRSLDGAALHDQPAILLGMLVMRLLDSRRLSTERFLTHRELTTHASFADGNQRECFAEVAGLAERLMYGPNNTADEQVARVVNAGRALLRQLDVSPSNPP